MQTGIPVRMREALMDGDVPDMMETIDLLRAVADELRGRFDKTQPTQGKRNAGRSSTRSE